MSSPDLRLSVEVQAPAAEVWSLISDVVTIPRWSNEVAECRWLDDPAGPRPGARFVGANRRGLHRWTTTCTVTTCEPGRSFAYDVAWSGIPIARWGWDFAQAGAPGWCVVTHWTTDLRSWWISHPSALLTGVGDRRAQNEESIRRMLLSLKHAPQAAGTAARPGPRGR